ncbi:polysaccharide pyruvyl transferase family protein [Propylenella binzhouense]|uniref:Polysaccharide pyruvyl transferase family protein n=1 Tax=Propylenella binzhouense TaxID=2555902 RepID=A0A964T1K5_9HYPH|nr:polysaccharide pyruvyl transferase family protein [Propylenella binzhouense]MYZ46569.1 polysaccharide pyruvyl transferase family protein [Propylenella binzhouense]
MGLPAVRVGAPMIGQSAGDHGRRVFMAGLFDLRNYGDLLFPLLADRRLAQYGYRIQPVTPAGGSCGWADTTPCIALEGLFAEEGQPAGVLIGGGNIVYGGVRGNHLLPNSPETADRGELAAWGPPGLWLGPALAAAVHDVPILWNAPGLPHPLAGHWRSLLGSALDASDYVSVREEMSRSLALETSSRADIRVVPDSAAELARLWPKAGLAAVYRTLLERKGARPDVRIWAIHLRDRSLGEHSLAELAREIDRIAARTGLTPALVAIGPGLGDATMVRELNDRLTVSALPLDDPAGPREIAALISHAHLYVGASLHGYITAAAYGVPGLLVARPRHRKFSGFVSQIGRSGDLKGDWCAALDAVPPALAEGPSARIPDEVHARLDRHWAAIAAALSNPARSRAARAAFLRTVVRLGLRTPFGPAWLLSPMLRSRAHQRPGASA